MRAPGRRNHAGGYQFRSRKFLSLLSRNGLRGSMGRGEACGDNAAKDAPPNGCAGCADPKGPWQRVSEMQDKLHRWAVADPGRPFDDVFNLVHDPATLRVAFHRLAGNRGRNSPGIDGVTTDDVEHGFGVDGFLEDMRLSLKGGSFRSVPVRQRRIPKPGGSEKLRKPGIPTIAH
ncbi:hypothetical protein ACIA5H_37265 [Nocardia sp. NPDC051900]|uniref:hypothetical protein n=1 Tax=Nocardia sp. NPDC051900 TaxID=3364326 RepID=UPI0037B8364D